MSFIVSVIVFLAAFVILMVKRASGLVLSIGLAVILLLISALANLGIVVNAVFWIAFLIIAIPFNLPTLRRQYFTSKVLAIYKKNKPSISRTEQEALDSGTVGWEGDLFTGDPDWKKLYAYPVSELTEREQNFLDNEVNTACEHIDRWEIENTPIGLPQHLWDYLRENKFFAMNIPEQYGGLGFSSRAYSEVIAKIGSISGSSAIVSSVPNSLGPAELLLHYGTEEQKQYYLPRLANGDEVPCFALTSASAGSDASSMQDYGLVCEHELNGVTQLCIKLNFSKRYITLAPVATVIGLAFKLYDPEHLLGDEQNIGITCALIPADTPGINIGKYHMPLRQAFPNGPIQGEDVIISLDQVIGGREQVGGGWRMLMECLADGRGVSIPSIVIGGAKAATLATGAYTRIRKQFNCSLVDFEGISKPLVNMVTTMFASESVRRFITSALDAGERPAVASGIAKLHVSEMGRQQLNNAMDIIGGRGICMGPNNYMAQEYFGMPVGITVEGANILTRNMIIFGQGATRCHPYILNEIAATEIENKKESLLAFDKAFCGHLMYYLQNIAGGIYLGLTNARFANNSGGKMKRYEQLYSRFSTILAILTDTTIITLGSALKRKENISARLGDLLSYLYIGSAALKYHHDYPVEGLDEVMEILHQDLIYKLQTTTYEIINNLPRKVRFLLKLSCLPLGRRLKQPKDKLEAKVAKMFTTSSAIRDALSINLYLAPNVNNPGGKLCAAIETMIKFNPLENKIIKAAKNGELQGYNFAAWLDSALEKSIITQEEFDFAKQANELRSELIAVDSFSLDEILAAHKNI